MFKELGIAGVSAKYRSSAEVKAAKEQAQEREQGEGAGAAKTTGGRTKKKKKDKPKAVGHSGRGASDFFLLEVSLDGIATEILRDISTVRTRTPVHTNDATVWPRMLQFVLRRASFRFRHYGGVTLCCCVWLVQGEHAQICIKNNRLKTKVKETIGWEEQGEQAVAFC